MLTDLLIVFVVVEITKWLCTFTQPRDINANLERVYYVPEADVSHGTPVGMTDKCKVKMMVSFGKVWVTVYLLVSELSCIAFTHFSLEELGGCGCSSAILLFLMQAQVATESQ